MLPPVRPSPAVRFLLAAVSVCLVGVPVVSASAPVPEGAIPFDSRWDFANYVTWRPANERPAALNPPRFSWPTSPTIVPTALDGKLSQPSFPAREYLFQLSQNPEFPAGKGTIEKRTRINFENALPVLAEGAWHWRVGYAKPGEEPDQWSAIRSFTIVPGTLAIDRTPIGRAVEEVSKLPHPRLGPADGDWAALRKRLEADPFTAPIMERLLSSAEKIITQDWWKDFPKDDTAGGSTEKAVRARLCVTFRDIGRDLATVALAHRFTGDERFRPVYEYALRAAKFPPGGETSPEFHGSTAKWGTRWIPRLAYVYDLGWNEYTPEQRAQLRAGLAWRMDAVFNKAGSWRAADGRVWVGGIGAFTQSHPYENSQIALPGLLLLAGEEPVADALIPVMLNYLLGVGAGHGPEGAWNEAGAYVFYKSKEMLDAALVADKLLPELRVAEYPWFTGIGDFVIQLAPPGMRRQGFGDYTEDMSGADRRNNLAYLLQRVAALTGSPAARKSLAGLGEAGFDTAIYDSLVPLVAGYASPAPRPEFSKEDATLPAAKIYSEPGWFFVSNTSPSDWEHARDAVRMVTLARPRGGYSHSYSHDGAFVWQAFGTTLSAGGGPAVYGDAYSRNGFSHNGILVNGHGASFRNFFSENPISARPIFWSHDAATDTTRWAGDMTGGFLVSPETEKDKSNAPYLKDLPADRGAPGLQRWIRHYALVNGRDVVMVDDLAMRSDADPARFTWLYHVPGTVPVEHDDPAGLRARYTLDGVEATVRQFSSVPVEVKHLRGSETLVNPLTGTDYTTSVQKGVKGRGKPLENGVLSGEVIAATTEPVREARLITVLTARPNKEEKPAAVDITPDAVTITRDGKSTRVTIDGADTSETVNLPVLALRHFAEESDPYRLPPSGTHGTLDLPSAESTPVEWLRQDTFSDAAWVNRWGVETQNALVRAVPDKGLEVRMNPNNPDAKNDGTTVWLRAEVPDRLVVRMKATNGSRETENRCNLNLILRARQTAEQSLILGSRTGDYSELHKESNYIVTFVGGDKPGWSRIRRDPGFSLESASEVRSEPGKTYELVYIFDQGRLRAWINGKLVHDWTDPNPLPNGKLGLRTYHSDIMIHSVEIGRLQADTTTH